MAINDNVWCLEMMATMDLSFSNPSVCVYVCAILCCSFNRFPMISVSLCVYLYSSTGANICARDQVIAQIVLDYGDDSVYVHRRGGNKKNS